MTISQKLSEKISLTMKSEGHYKKAAESYRRSEQYINMINLYPILQNTLLDCKNENLIEWTLELLKKLDLITIKQQFDYFLISYIY